MLIVAQPGKRTVPKGDAVANARASLDGGDVQQESQHGALLAAGVGLEGLKPSTLLHIVPEIKFLDGFKEY